MEEPRKFEIKDRTKAKDEQTKSRVSKAVVAGVVILGGVAAVHFGGDLVDFGEVLSVNVVSYGLIAVGIRSAIRGFAKAKENKKERRNAELKQIFEEVEREEMELGGNEDVRTKWNPNSRW